MADDLHNIPDHRGISSLGGNCASRRRRVIAKNERLATRIGQRFQVPMSSVRQKSDFQAAQREAKQSDLRFSISAGNDHGGCPRWLWGASGRIFLECGQQNCALPPRLRRKLATPPLELRDAQCLQTPGEASPERINSCQPCIVGAFRRPRHAEAGGLWGR